MNRGSVAKYVRLLFSCFVVAALASATSCLAAEDVNPAVTDADSFIYKAAGRRDPFEPLIDQLQETSRVVVSKPRGPLQQYELPQFRLMAVLVVNGRPMAMVKAPDGKSYPVKIGDEIGRYEGKVTRIETKMIERDAQGKRIEKSPDRIIVEEIIRDNFSGKQSVEKRYLTM